MDYYAGLEVSLRSCALCIVDEKGSVRLERELPCEIEAIADALADFPNPVARVGFEAGTMSQHLYFHRGKGQLRLEPELCNNALTASLFAWSLSRWG